jgi:DNA-binding transcriptional LysR family regulator
MRADLNDFAYFAEVVAHGGFAAAGRALREPKSKLSRRIAGLEDRLGLRLIERSSRRFRVSRCHGDPYTPDAGRDERANLEQA